MYSKCEIQDEERERAGKREDGRNKGKHLNGTRSGSARASGHENGLG